MGNVSSITQISPSTCWRFLLHGRIFWVVMNFIYDLEEFYNNHFSPRSNFLSGHGFCPLWKNSAKTIFLQGKIFWVIMDLVHDGRILWQPFDLMFSCPSTFGYFKGDSKLNHFLINFLVLVLLALVLGILGLGLLRPPLSNEHW